MTISTEKVRRSVAIQLWKLEMDRSNKLMRDLEAVEQIVLQVAAEVGEYPPNLNAQRIIAAIRAKASHP